MSSEAEVPGETEANLTRKGRGLRSSEALFRSLVQSSPDLILVLGANFVVHYVSPSAERILGYRAEELIGRPMPGRIREVGDARSTVNVDGSDGTSPLTKVEMLHADGSWHHLEAVGVDLLDDTGIEGRAYYVRDGATPEPPESELVRQAFHDPLTNLANRRLFMNRLEHALASGPRREGPVSVLFLDVDDFKTINDGFGHAAGDLLLTMVGQRIQSIIRPEDTVARIGGDEFAVLLDDATDASNAAHVAERIVVALKEPVSWVGHTLFVTISVGTASSASGLNTAEGLLQAADSAMYRAKGNGKARCEVFEEGLPTETIRRMRLGKDLRGAVDRGELRVYYQPEVLLETNEIMGMEALVRWEHPERGLVMPRDFVLLAEEDGLIVTMGQWILGEACRQALLWQEYSARADLSVSVNLSARQFRQPALAQTVAAVLRETGLPAYNLILEVTESFLVEDDEHVINTLRQLKSIGVRLAIDDFGTGYSALSYLDKFPVDFLKIDRSFVGKLSAGDGGATAIVPLLVDLTHKLGIKAIAEGVETAAQLEELRGMRCDVAQGYYFSEPLPESAARELIRSGSSSLGKPPGGPSAF